MVRDEIGKFIVGDAFCGGLHLSLHSSLPSLNEMVIIWYYFQRSCKVTNLFTIFAVD